ncbi:unnamed protein product [Brachionus calyciflorus]|uniref:TBC1 domain-containing protein n=1 Tax=Brachionus calyciflorus TaxID=104777 RepID=A0A813WH53_9BILA|nr:unnamed protein product [Brachionus calyciflorus]
MSETKNLNDAENKIEEGVENVNLKVWLEKPDVLHKFKCFYREKREESKLEWIPGYLVLTKTHLYGLTQSSNVENGMAQISVQDQTKKEASSSVSINEAASKSQKIPRYVTKGKEWFYVPDYSGEAATAVKLQILEVFELN